jgi:hypothetical protein
LFLSVTMARFQGVWSGNPEIETRLYIMNYSSRLALVPPRAVWLCVVMLCLGSFLGGCKAAGGTVTQNPVTPPAADFALAMNPTSVSIAAGGLATTSLSVTAINGFSSQVSIQIGGLPTGISASPSTITLTPGTAQTVTFSAAAGMSATTTTATFTGTTALLTHSMSLNFSVTAGISSALPTRTRYVRTDAATEYYLWLNTHWVVYNSATSRFFVTDPRTNQVLVLDSIAQKKVANIPVPGAFGIDDTPDHETLYVGTLSGDVYTIDVATLAVTRRYLASQIGPYGYQAFTAQVLADGRVALLGAQGGIPSVDGSQSFAIWNPNDNSILVYGGAAFGVPALPDCVGNIGGFTRTADRTKVILGSIDSDTTLCEVDESGGQKNYVTAVGTFSTMKITTSPDGKYIALRDYFPASQVAFYDAHTLTLLAQFDVKGDVSSASELLFSADSKTLFVSSDSIVYAYDVATHQQIGWMPNIVVEYSSGGYAVGPATGPNFGAVDGTGLLAGPMEQGFGFLDSSKLQTGPVGTNFANAYLNPATGTAAGGTPVTWSAPPTIDAQSKIYFGADSSPSVTPSKYNITVTTPPGAPGVVDVYAFANDGGMQLIPDGFSYGPTILQVTPDTATADGGGTGIAYGYGFGSANATKIPTDLRVTVGTSPATVTGFNPNAYNNLSPPFLLQSVYFTIPAGSSGSVDVTVSTSSGITTTHGALTYLAAPQEFPLAGSTLAQGIYDPLRDVYYFTDVNRIQVFSLAQRKWLSPINPAPNGVPQRLWGIALSPDSSKLAVGDVKGSVVYLIDPSNPSSTKTFAIAPSVPQGVIVNPAGIAISDAGVVYATMFVQGGTGYESYYRLDTKTGTLTGLGVTGPQFSIDGAPQDLYLKTAISSDNTRVFFNNDGYVFSLDTATNRIFSSKTGPGCCYGDYDLALSKNQTRFEATSDLFDSDLNGESFLALNDREVQAISYVYGTKLSPDGSLLFQPSTNGIDVFDGRIGTLRNRIAFPFSLSTNYDALVEDGKDNVLLAITGTHGDGVAIVDLTSISEPRPLPYDAARSSSQGLPAVRHSTPAEDFRTTRNTRKNSNQSTANLRVIPHVTNPNALHPQ